MHTTTTYRNARRRRLTKPGRKERQPARYLVDVRGLEHVPADEIEELRSVTDTFAFRANDYYLRLIDWSDPHDPIRRLVVPCLDELRRFGELDVSDEAANTKLLGLQHKYRDTVLLLVTDQCGGFCRYCFRKRLFLPTTRETNRQIDAGLEYIRAHREVTDVLLTGGDPLTLPAARLGEIIDTVRAIEHVHTIRIGTKIPAFNPYQILRDRELQNVFRSHAADAGRIYMMCHFDHPRELTRSAVAAITLLRELGVMCVNQCPIIAGVNDDADVLAELFQACTDSGCPQYYIFQCRPTAGNGAFEVPLVRSFELVAEAKTRLSGLARQARLCMSHATGKIEIVGLGEKRIWARYHRAKNPDDEGRVLVLKRDDTAHWLDQLEPA